MSNRLRSKMLGIRLNDKELTYVKNKINTSGLSQREYLLHCLSDKQIVVKPHGIEIVRELKAIGNNLNQIAHKVNSGEIIDCTLQLENIYGRIGELMERWQ